MRKNWIITAKAITYRFFAGSVTFMGSWILTGSAETGGKFTLGLMAIHFAQFWLHEKAWSWVEARLDKKDN